MLDFSHVDDMGINRYKLEDTINATELDGETLYRFQLHNGNFWAYNGINAIYQNAVISLVRKYPQLKDDPIIKSLIREDQKFQDKIKSDIGEI